MELIPILMTLTEYDTEDRITAFNILYSDCTFIERRLERLTRIEHGSEGSCSITYMGSSKNLRQRLEQLLCKEDRHTIEHPVRALLLNRWLVECAWKATPNYREEEKQLKTVFKMEHSGALPPLVDR